MSSGQRKTGRRWLPPPSHDDKTVSWCCNPHDTNTESDGGRSFKYYRYENWKTIHWELQVSTMNMQQNHTNHNWRNIHLFILSIAVTATTINSKVFIPSLARCSSDRLGIEPHLLCSSRCDSKFHIRFGHQCGLLYHSFVATVQVTNRGIWTNVYLSLPFQSILINKNQNRDIEHTVAEVRCATHTPTKASRWFGPHTYPATMSQRTRVVHMMTPKHSYSPRSIYILEYTTEYTWNDPRTTKLWIQ